VKKRSSARTRPQGRSHLIAFLTDFGLEDHYAAAMKAVILSVNPNARFIDVTHNVRPQQVQEAGYLLWSSYKYFPKRTVFVCVVDPGVGTERKILAAKSSGYVFLAPDNGLLNFVLSGEKKPEVREVEIQRSKLFHLENVSTTFHGRDIFAPIAALISKSGTISMLGRKLKHDLLSSPFVKGKSDPQKPAILHIDHFGNVVTNIQVKAHEAQGIRMMSVGNSLVSRWIRNYEEAPDRTPCMIIGSSGLVEVVVKKDNAAKLLNATIHTPLSVYWV